MLSKRLWNFTGQVEATSGAGVKAALFSGKGSILQAPGLVASFPGALALPVLSLC